MSHSDQEWIGQEPQVFTGQRDQAESFEVQWQLFDKLNFQNHGYTPYQRAMILLTYVQGPLVNEWVQAQVRIFNVELARGVPLEDPSWLMQLEYEFHHKFKDTAAREKARDELYRGSPLMGYDVDTYVTHFVS